MIEWIGRGALVYLMNVGIAWLAWRAARLVTGWPELDIYQAATGVGLIWICHFFWCFGMGYGER